MKGSTPVPRDTRQRSFARLVAILAGAVIVFISLMIAYQAATALNALPAIEAERDHWQRPDDVIEELHLRQGSSVVDLGCGSGYFALKLSQTVGANGQVTAVDIRSLPLVFLKMRALLQHRSNIQVVHSAPTGPGLPVGTIDGVLIANTYHELEDRGAILSTAFEALRQGGRVVIVDRGEPVDASRDSNHHISLAEVESNFSNHGFQSVLRLERFIERPADGTWWLLVVQKP